MSRMTSGLVAVGYCGLSFLYFGLRVAQHPQRDYVGAGADPQIFVWAFAWWPHALLHGDNPIVSHAIWAPDGVDLAWTVSVPGLALALAPVTVAAGPVAAYNVAAVLLPALAAWTAFLLCRHVTGALWASILGGYLFGFSSYMVGQELGHLHMTSVFLLPLVALVVLRFVEGTLAPRALMLRLGALLAGQLLLSTEVFFTASVALVAGAAIAYALVPLARPRLRALAVPAAGAYALSAVLTAPLLVYAIADFETSPINDPRDFPADLLNVVVPTRLLAAGGGPTDDIARKFPASVAEQGAYVGLPALAIAVWYAWLRRRSAGGRFVVASFAAAALAMLGTALHVGGNRLAPLPWALLTGLPGFSNVLPARLAVYASLALAVLVASWAATARVPRAVRVALPLAAAAALVPNVAVAAWHERPHRIAFFTDDSYRECLPRGTNVVILPYGGAGWSMLWQAEAGFRFRQAGGYVRPQPPSSFLRWPAVGAFDRAEVPSPADVRAFAGAKHVAAFVVDDAAAGGRWRPSLDPLVEPVTAGGALVYPLGAALGPPCG